MLRNGFLPRKRASTSKETKQWCWALRSKRVCNKPNVPHYECPSRAALGGLSDVAVYTGMQLFTDNASLSMSIVASCFLQQSKLMLLSRKKSCKKLLLPFQQALVVSAMQMFHSLKFEQLYHPCSIWIVLVWHDNNSSTTEKPWKQPHSALVRKCMLFLKWE